jgi:hypothetical protein
LIRRKRAKGILGVAVRRDTTDAGIREVRREDQFMRFDQPGERGFACRHGGGLVVIELHGPLGLFQ